MTELERRAMLGDRHAQEECTRKGVVLPCPKCYGKVKFSFVKFGRYFLEFEYKCSSCGLTARYTQYIPVDKQLAEEPTALSRWNTRPAPPIGRCKDCKHAGEFGEWSFAICKKKSEHHNFTVKRDDSCNHYEPRHPYAT